ncbi:type IV toxin-antitoxin system YeeU family antitoxin [Escherichia coli]|nr:type IV toxin-antitoxin system YeeU family antitoxin [Escherichia coli]
MNEKGWQAIKSGAVATDTVVNTGAEGGPDAENGDTGQFVRGNAVRTTINENGRQIVAAEGTANTTVVYAGGDQTVHGYALDTTLNGGNQYVHNGGNRLHYLADRAGIRGRFSNADAYHLDQAFPLLMKQLELMLTSGELNPRHQHTVTLYAKGLTCDADTLGSCGYVYLAVYPATETESNPPE